MIETGQMRAAARELQAEATRRPLARAPRGGEPHERRFFRQISRQVAWGLTLNK